MRRILLIIGAAAGAGSLCFLLSYAFLNTSRDARLSECMEQTVTDRTDCLFGVIENEIERRDLASGFAAFENAYRISNGFNKRCHAQAHRFGDLAYYRSYLDSDLSLHELSFPPEAAACGYGFITGFLMHYFQDRAGPEEVLALCSNLPKKLIDIGYSEAACYHAAGHGFTHAREDVIREGDLGKFSILEVPLKECESLPVSDVLVGQCRQAAYQQLIEWMMLSQYGFSFNEKAPFAFCDQGPEKRRRDCYIQVAVRLYVTKNGIGPEIDLEALIDGAPGDLKEVVRHVAIDGKNVLRIMQCSGTTEKDFWAPTCTNTPYLP